MAKSATSLASAPSNEFDLAVETVTPEQAKRWLEVDNHRNRKIRDGRVSYLADEIKAQRWQVTHSGIAFDTKGNLLDGQHRLAAVVKAGVPVRIVVARNVPPESYVAMDRGAMRTVTDVLRGDQRTVSVATAIVRHVQVNSTMAPVSPEDVQMVLTALEAEIALANSVRLLRPLVRVQFRCALALRLAAQGGAGWSDLLMEQWRALNQTDATKMDQTSSTLMRRLLSENATRHTDALLSRLMTLAWQAFDPTQRERQQFHIDNAAYKEMIIAARRVLRDRIVSFHQDGSRLERALASVEAL